VQKDGVVSKVLIVDDDEGIVIMLERLLKSAGYDVQAATNGKEAALVYAQYHPDLVVTDLIMPDGEGLQLIMSLRRQDKEVKIIAMTGGGRGGTQNYLFMAQELGADYTIEKPFLAEKLLSIVRLAIESDSTSPSMAIG
jgi:DNA-binding response OmpR family regulator